VTGYDPLAPPHTRGPAPVIIRTGEKEPPNDGPPTSPAQPWPFNWPNVAPKQAQE